MWGIMTHHGLPDDMAAPNALSQAVLVAGALGAK